MKVAIILPVFMTGGAESMATQLAMNLDRGRMDVEVISMYPRQGHIFEEKLEQAGILVHYIDKRGNKSIGAMFRLWSLLSRMKPDIIHGHLYASFYALPWVMLHKAKLVHTIHTKPTKEFSVKLRTILRIGAWLRKVQLVTISKVNQEIACQAYGCEAEKYPFINNPVDLDRFYHKDKNDGICTFINVSRLNYWKNLSLAIHAMPEVLQAVPKVRLLLVGDGELRDELEKEAVSLGVQNAVVFAGEQSRPEDFLAEADVYVLTSHVEGLPLSVLEAMASGLPIISTNVGGMQDLVKENGVLIEDGDLAALKCEMIRFAENHVLRIQCGKRSREMVNAYDVRCCAEQYAELYEKLCNA